jgi:transposase
VPVSATKVRPRGKSGSKTRWTREFKLKALARMEEAPDVTALAAELGVQRFLLYVWRRKYRAGGAEALQMIGRPSHQVGSRAIPSAAPPLNEASAARRIAELERKIGQQQLELDFFREALRHVGEAGLKKGGSGGKASSR